jgi:hypothetical protein
LPSYLLLGSAVHFLLIRVSLSFLQSTLLGSNLLGDSSSGAIACLELDSGTRIGVGNQGTIVSSAVVSKWLGNTTIRVRLGQFMPIKGNSRINCSIEALSMLNGVCAATSGTSETGVPILGTRAQSRVGRVGIACNFIQKTMKDLPVVVEARGRL